MFQDLRSSPTLISGFEHDYPPQSPRDDFDIRPNYDDVDDDFDSSGRDREQQRERDRDRDDEYDDRRDDGPADDPSDGCGSGDLTYEKVFVAIPLLWYMQRSRQNSRS